MLTITIPSRELYNEATEEFFMVKGQTLNLEHSLLSIAKWEQKYKKSFFTTEFTIKEFLDYVRCMTLTQNVDPSVYNGLTSENVEEIRAYMGDSATATTFSDKTNKPRPKGKAQQRIITSELVYGWMVTLNIPFECQKWHFNRLVTLIRVCQELQNPEKMDKRSVLKQNHALNAARKAKYHTRG